MMMRLLVFAAACMCIEGVKPDVGVESQQDVKENHRRLLREDRLLHEGVDVDDGDLDESISALVGSDGRMKFESLSEEGGNSETGNNFEEETKSKIKLSNSRSSDPQMTVYAEHVCPWWWNPPITTVNKLSANRRCYNNNFCIDQAPNTSCCADQSSNSYLCPLSAPYMCANRDTCGSSDATSYMCDYACVETSDLCNQTHGGLRPCQGPPGPQGPANTGQGVVGPAGPLGPAGSNADSNGGLPVSPTVAGVLIGAFFFNICAAVGVFMYFAQTYGWKRPGFGDPKPFHGSDEHFAEIEPTAHY